MWLSESQRLLQARGLVEELLALPYRARLQGLVQVEQDNSQAWLLERLQRLLGAQRTCATCGTKLYAGQSHTCDEPPWTPDPEFNQSWNEE